jgi:hypothetical protein
MIFVENYNRRLVIPNEVGILDKEMHCSLRHPFDVTCLDDTTVTVSTYNGIEATIVRPSTKMVHYNISTISFYV